MKFGMPLLVSLIRCLIKFVRLRSEKFRELRREQIVKIVIADEKALVDEADA